MSSNSTPPSLRRATSPFQPARQRPAPRLDVHDAARRFAQLDEQTTADPSGFTEDAYSRAHEEATEAWGGGSNTTEPLAPSHRGRPTQAVEPTLPTIDDAAELSAFSNGQVQSPSYTIDSRALSPAPSTANGAPSWAATEPQQDVRSPSLAPREPTEPVATPQRVATPALEEAPVHIGPVNPGDAARAGARVGCWGRLSKKQKWVSVGIILGVIVLGTAAAGTAGGLLHKSSSSSAPAASNQPSTTTPPVVSTTTTPVISSSASVTSTSTTPAPTATGTPLIEAQTYAVAAPLLSQGDSTCQPAIDCGSYSNMFFSSSTTWKVGDPNSNGLYPYAWGNGNTGTFGPWGEGLQTTLPADKGGTVSNSQCSYTAKGQITLSPLNATNTEFQGAMRYTFTGADSACPTQLTQMNGCNCVWAFGVGPNT